MDTTKCLHCSLAFAINAVKEHSEKCPKNPAVAERLIAILRSAATDGRICCLAEYVELSVEHKLPNTRMMYRTFGNWNNVAAWAGLAPHATRKVGEYMPKIWFDGVPTVMAEDLAPDIAFDVTPGWRVFGEWNMAERRYVPARAQQVYLIR